MKDNDNILGPQKRASICESCGEEHDLPARQCSSCFLALHGIAQKMLGSNLEYYLNYGLQNGISEFRVNHLGNGSFIIHPLGKDGKTMDFEIKVNL